MSDKRRLVAVPDIPEPDAPGSAFSAWLSRRRLATRWSRRAHRAARYRRDLDVLTDRVTALEEIQDRLADISADLLDILVQAGDAELALVVSGGRIGQDGQGDAPKGPGEPAPQS
jgi:hypothetical protein